MTEEKKNRISELTRISRERALTPEETAERLALREEYLADWRRGALETLNTFPRIGQCLCVHERVKNLDERLLP